MKAVIIEKENKIVHVVELMESPEGYVKFQKSIEVLTEKEFNEKYTISKKFEGAKWTF